MTQGKQAEAGGPSKVPKAQSSGTQRRLRFADTARLGKEEALGCSAAIGTRAVLTLFTYSADESHRCACVFPAADSPATSVIPEQMIPHERGRAGGWFGAKGSPKKMNDFGSNV